MPFDVVPSLRLTCLLPLLVLPLICAQGRASPGAAHDQQPQTLKLSSRIVVLDVVVTDRKGNLITKALNQDDFTIVEDKQVQTIRSFEPPSAHSMAGNGEAIVHSAADLPKIGDAPVTILVLDELNSRFEDMSFSRQMLVRYLESQPRVLSEPTSLLIAENRTFKQVNDYTQDRDILINVVKNHKPEYPFKMMNGKTGSGAVERIAQTMAALQQISQATAGIPGRKNLIWVGNGFPSADLVTLDTQEANTLEAAFRRITIRLLAARITLYTINPAPGTSSSVAAVTPYDLDMALDANGQSPLDGGSVSFSQLAPSTGGSAYRGRNDINNVIAEGIARGRSSYTLSYSPTNRSEDPAVFRNMKIVMKDKNMVATTRAGYYPEVPEDMSPMLDKTLSVKQVKANLTLDLSSALTSTMSYNGLNVTAEKSGSGIFAIHVASAGIGWLDTPEGAPEHEEVTVAAAWYDAKGKLVGHSAQEEFASRGVSADSGASYSLAVNVPPNAVRLRFVVRDAFNGHMGTAALATSK